MAVKGLTLCPLGIFYTLLASADFVQNHLFRKILSDIVYCIIPSEYQTVWIQIRPHILLGLIWVQTVCKGYQQTTLGGTALTIHFCILLYFQTAFEINSHHTELVCSQFDDRFFIIVTQFNKIGTLVSTLSSSKITLKAPRKKCI